MISGTQNSMELLGKSKEELREFCVALGEPAFRGAQIYHALYAERKFDVRQITNLPSALRERLAKEARVILPEVKQRFASTDGSVRYLFGLPGGKEKLARPTSVEAVFMPGEGRQTICISTQAGCAVDCHFCLTAQLGLIRNLTAGEILAQVLLPLEEHKAQLAPQTNIVLMGQGEPLLNFEPVMAAVRIMLDPEGMGISPKHVTLSTSGIVPGIERLAQEKVRPKLAISGTIPLVESVTCFGEIPIPSGSSMIRTAAITGSKFSSGSPWPIKTMFVCGASCALCSSSGKSTCARISPAVRLRISPSCAVRQKWQSTAQPACVETQIVCRPSLGINTASTDAGFPRRPAFSLPLFSAFSVLSVSSVLNSSSSLAAVKPNKYRTEPSSEANRCRTSGNVIRASFDSRSRSTTGRFVISTTSNFLSEYKA